MTTPRSKQLRRSYGFDEVAIVPGDITINPDQTNIDFKVENFTFYHSENRPGFLRPRAVS